MEDLQRIDVLGKRGLLVDDSFQFLVLLLNGIDTFLMFSDQVFTLYFDPLCESCDFFVLDDDALVEIGAQLVLSLVEILSYLVDLVLEKQDLELVVIYYT
jgi:hypothetical protein